MTRVACSGASPHSWRSGVYSLATSPRSTPTSSEPAVLTPSTESRISLDPADSEHDRASTPRNVPDEVSSLAAQSVQADVRESIELVDTFNQLGVRNQDGAFRMSGLQSVVDRLSSLPSSRDTSSRHSTPRTTEQLSPPPANFTRRRSSPRTAEPPHDVSEEELPRDRFHDPSFHHAFEQTIGVARELKDVLGSGSLHEQPGSTIQRLHQTATALADFHCPGRRVVGFVGDTGAGKSSLLNSLLDFRAIARASNNGVACTCIATEYHYHDRDDFVIEVEIFSRAELDDMLRDMLQVFRQYELHGDAMVEEEKKEYYSRHEVAWSTFQSMFKGRLADSSQPLTSGTEDAVLGMLRTWARAIDLEPLAGRRTFATLSEASDHLVGLTSDPRRREEQAIWPFLKSLRVFTKSYVLSRGLVFADLPGLRDLNNARRNITERYLLQCDEIFAVTGIGRAASDAGIKDVVDLAKRANLSNVSIICTRSDDFKIPEILTDWEGTRANRIEALQDAVNACETELEQVKADLDFYAEVDEMDPAEINHQMELNRRRARLGPIIDARNFELRQYIVNTRNRKITRKLRPMYGAAIPSNELKVFCISNEYYWTWREEPRDKSAPWLQLSGIIDLRRHCISLVSESQYRSALRYIRHDMAAFLGDLGLWIQSGAPSLDAELKREMRDVAVEVERRLKSGLTGRQSLGRNFASGLKSDFEDFILSPETDVTDWSAGARNSAADWATWHHQSYAAFCRKFGDHCTAAVGYRNWNEEALESMNQDLAQPWRTLVKRAKDKGCDNTSSVDDLIRGIVTYIEANTRGSSDLLDILIDALESRQAIIKDALGNVGTTMNSKLSLLRTEAFSGIRTSLMGEAMEPAYRDCNGEYGTGCDRRRKTIMNRHIAREELFQGILTETARRFSVLITKGEADIQRVLREQFAELKATLEIVRGENAAAEGDQDPQFRARVDNALRKSKGVMEEILRVIADVSES